MQGDRIKMSDRTKIANKHKGLFAKKDVWERFTNFLLDRIGLYRFRQRHKVVDYRYLRTSGDGGDNGGNRLVHICNIKPPRS